MKFSVSLNQKDIKRLQKHLEQYSKSLEDKCREFTRKLLERGIEVANARIEKGNPNSDTPKPKVDIKVHDGLPVSGSLIVSGEGVLFWEFGSGNYYNPQENPKAAEFGMGTGTYPGQTHVPDPGYWFYYKDGEKKKENKRFSRGTMATMPTFMADVEMINSIEEVAREVFGNV